MGKASVNKGVELTVIGSEEKGKRVILTGKDVIIWLFNQPKGKYKLGDKVKAPCPPVCDHS